MRRFPSVLTVSAIALLGVAPSARSQECRPTPEKTLAEGLLAALPQSLQLQRKPAVDATLVNCPGAIEQFLSSLMSREFLLARHADPNGNAGPSGPAGVEVIRGRNTSYEVGEARTIDFGGTDYRVREFKYVSPLLLDLDEDGVPDVNGSAWEPHQGIDLDGPIAAFDIDGDGYRDLVEWVGSGDGLLVDPEDPAKVVVTTMGLQWNGPVSGRDLLGTAGGWRDGFEKVSVRDIDANHVLEGTELAGLYLWHDDDADGVIDAGELQTLGDFGITRLETPLPGGCIGAYYRPDQTGGNMWDWWPSYFTVDQVSAAGTPPTSLPISFTPLPDLSYNAPPVGVGADGLLAASSLEFSGVDLASARIVAVAPDGGWVVFEDRWPESDRPDGYARRLWLLGGPFVPGTSVVPRVVPLPVSDILQFVFRDPDHALIVADAGSTLLQLRLTAGPAEAIRVTGGGAPRGGGAGGGFRCSFHAFRAEGEALISVTFQDADGNSGPDRLARIDETVDPPVLAGVSDLGAAYDVVSGLGTVLNHVPAKGNRSFFLVVSASDPDGRLYLAQGGTATSLDQDISPLGLASAGDRVLYLRPVPGSAELEVRVRDVATGDSHTLAQGAYSYPYLVADGTRAVFTEVDWAGHGMRVWAAPAIEDAPLEEVLTCGIGAIRVADDASVLGCLAPEGLYVTTRVAADVPRNDGPWKRLSARPNPFRADVAFRFVLTEQRRVRAEVVTVEGRRVARLIDELRPAGEHEVVWKGLDDGGRPVPAGEYFVRIQDGERTIQSRVTRLR